MAQFYTNWREYGAAAQPFDWSVVQIQSGSSPGLISGVVVDVPDAPSASGKALLVTGPRSSSGIITWSQIPENEEIQEALALIGLDTRTGGSPSLFGPAVCARGTGSSDFGFYAACFNIGIAQSTLAIWRGLPGPGIQQLASGTFQLTDRTRPVWVRVRAEPGVGVRAKAWYYGDPEPAGWNVTLNNTELIGTGRPGLFSMSNAFAPQTYVNHVYRFGAGTAGDPALGSFPPSAPALPFPRDGAIVKGIIAVPIGAAIDPDGDPLQYEIDISEDGGQSFIPLLPLSPELVRLWDVSSRPLGPNRQLRARAFDGMNYGPYAFSGVFTTVENQAPQRPTATATVLGRGTVRLTGSEFDDPDEGDVHIATRYRILDSQNNVVAETLVNNPVELTSKVFSGLQAGQYMGEMVYLSSDGTQSPPGVAVFVLQGVTQIQWEDCPDA